MHYVGLLDRRAADLLFQARPLAPLERRKLDRRATTRRFIERPDNAHVGQPFLRAGLRIVTAQDAVGKIEQLRSELVALREAALARLAAEGQAMLERHGVLERRLDDQVPFGAYEPVSGNVGGAEAAGK